MKKSKGNLLITFIVVVSLSALILIFIQLVAVRLTDSNSRVNEAQAFYIADAGLHKAIWYLGTAVAQRKGPGLGGYELL